MVDHQSEYGRSVCSKYCTSQIFRRRQSVWLWDPSTQSKCNRRRFFFLFCQFFFELKHVVMGVQWVLKSVCHLVQILQCFFTECLVLFFVLKAECYGAIGSVLNADNICHLRFLIFLIVNKKNASIIRSSYLNILIMVNSGETLEDVAA